MKTLRTLTLALLVAGAGIAQEQTYTDGRTTAHYIVAATESGYTVTVCATTTDPPIGLFRVQYVASLPDGSEITFDGFLLRRDLGSCRYVASTSGYPFLTGLVVTPQRATTPLVAMPLPSNTR
jgi:hypothetical protein